MACCSAMNTSTSSTTTSTPGKRQMDYSSHHEMSVKRKRTGTMFTTKTTTNATSSLIDTNAQKTSPFNFMMSNDQSNENLMERIKDEAKRLIKRKQIQHVDTNETNTSQNLLSKSDVPLFTLAQVNTICDKLVKEHEDKLKEKYDLILSQKLNEQYDTFVKFTHDQIQKKFTQHDLQFSYVS